MNMRMRAKMKQANRKIATQNKHERSLNLDMETKQKALSQPLT